MKLKITILCLLAALAVWRFLSVDEILQYVTPVIFIAMLALLPIFCLGFGLSGKRLEILLGQHNRVGMLCAVKAVILTNGLNCIFPGRLSEFVKPLYFKKNKNTPFTASLSVVILERSTDLFMLLLAVLILASLGFELQWHSFVLMAAILLVLIFTIPYCQKIYAAIIAKIIPWPSGKTALSNILCHLAESVRANRIWGGLLCAVFIWLCSFSTIFIFFYLTLGSIFSWQIALEFFTAVTLAYMIPGLPGGIGVYEAAGIFVLSSWGISYEQGLVLSASLHLAQMAFSLLGAFIIILSEKIEVKQFKSQILQYKAKLRHTAEEVGDKRDAK